MSPIPLRVLLCLAAVIFISCASSTSTIRNNSLQSMLPVKDLPVDNFENPTEFLVWANVPRSTTVGHAFSIAIDFANHQKNLPFLIESIDISGFYLRGFEVVGISPAPQSYDCETGELSIQYEQNVPPGESWHVDIQLLPKEVGVYSGDLDVWWDTINATRRLQTVVTN